MNLTIIVIYQQENIQVSYKPLRDLILLKLDDAAEKNATSLIVVHNPDKPTTGVVVATGTGVRNKNGEIEPLAVKAGDRIMIVQGSGKDIKVGNEQLLIVHESDIIVVFD